MMKAMAHKNKNFHFTIRVYYEDTDAGGVVYYANYLKFAERARSEWLRQLGINQQELRTKEGLGFVVTHATIDFKQPARLDDEITIETRLHHLSKARMSMRQTLRRNDAVLVEMTVEIACVRGSKPARIPEEIAALFTPLLPRPNEEFS
jgi:acyl-CoA thioester hydrolase